MAYRVSRAKMGALALASALAGSGVQAFGCSGAQAFRGSGSTEIAPYLTLPARTPERPNARTPEHRPPALAPSPRAWTRWWRSRRRPRTEQQTIRLSGRPVVLFREALLPGWQYPCTGSELEAALRELPPAWTARLRSVRLTFHPEWDAHARTDRSRIEISYIVDETLHAPGEVIGDTPEELQFGARVEVWGGARHFIWPDRDTLRIYTLRHLLIHELGHHVAPLGLRPREEEEWAEAFAFRYYTPPAPKPVVAAR